MGNLALAVQCWPLIGWMGLTPGPRGLVKARKTGAGLSSEESNLALGCF